MSLDGFMRKEDELAMDGGGETGLEEGEGHRSRVSLLRKEVNPFFLCWLKFC